LKAIRYLEYSSVKQYTLKECREEVKSLGTKYINVT
jgi:hypothetical protein